MQERRGLLPPTEANTYGWLPPLWCDLIIYNNRASERNCTWGGMLKSRKWAPGSIFPKNGPLERYLKVMTKKKKVFTLKMSDFA